MIQKKSKIEDIISTPSAFENNQSENINKKIDKNFEVTKSKASLKSKECREEANEEFDKLIESFHIQNTESLNTSDEDQLHDNNTKAVLDSTNTHIKMERRLKKILLEVEQIADRKNSEIPIDHNKLDSPHLDGKEYFEDFEILQREDACK